MTLSDQELIEAEAVLEEIEEMLKSGDVDAILAWCSDVAKARTARVAATAVDTGTVPPEPATEPAVVVTTLEDPPPIAADEPEPAGIFQTGPDVLERVLERQEMQPYRQRFYTDRQDRFRRRWR